jgi:hypothetical protein
MPERGAKLPPLNSVSTQLSLSAPVVRFNEELGRVRY